MKVTTEMWCDGVTTDMRIQGCAAAIVIETELYTPSGGGGSGSGVSPVNFTQATPLAVWTIIHGLGRYPSVTVRDTQDNVILPSISYPNPDTVQITHSAAYAGKAYLI